MVFGFIGKYFSAPLWRWARKSANLFTRRAICLQDGEGFNDEFFLCTSVALGRENLSVCLQDGQFVNKMGKGTKDNNNLAFLRGGPERGNPATTTKRLRQEVEEIHQHK